MGNVPRRRVFVARKSDPKALIVLHKLEKADMDVVELDSFRSIQETPGIDYYAVTKHPRPSAPVALDVIGSQKYVLFDENADVTADQVLMALTDNRAFA